MQDDREQPDDPVHSHRTGKPAAVHADSELFSRAKSGDRAALSRAITEIEILSAEGRRLLSGVAAGRAEPRVTGWTGAPGAGKSSLISVLVSERLREQPDARIAVIAIDPSSSVSGGAVLGDRIRMDDHALDPRVYIRSMASRGMHGGLAPSAMRVARFLSAMGFAEVHIETVGAGQSDVEIGDYADTTIVVLSPSAGDSIQGLKAGILEIADLFVVNKSDLAGADSAAAALDCAVTPRDTGWMPTVLLASARERKGIEALSRGMDAHYDFLRRSGFHGELYGRRRTAEFDDIVSADAIKNIRVGTLFDKVSLAVKIGELGPVEAAERIISAAIRSPKAEPDDHIRAAAVFKSIHHVGIAVRDLEPAIRFFKESLGLDPGGSEEVADQKVRVVFFQLGESRIELLQSTSSDGPISKFIEKKGPGLHHLTLQTDDIVSDLARIKTAGGRLIDQQPRSGAHGSRIAFVHPETTGGFLLELCQIR